MNTQTLRNTLRAAALCGVALLVTTGCDKKANNSINFQSAINTYYTAHPACIWDTAKKFPVQANTSDDSKTSNYDALVDQGLLLRTTAEKKIIIISKQVNNYDLSDQGRAAWTPDPSQPGFGNFCYGHRAVSSIDGSTPTTDAVGATTQISYHYTFTGAPAWATAAETQTAYPQIRTNLAAPQVGQATLTNTANGWAVSSAPGSNPGRRVTNADGSIVQ